MLLRPSLPVRGVDTLHHARQHQIDCHQSVRSYENVSASSSDFPSSFLFFLSFKKEEKNNRRKVYLRMCVGVSCGYAHYHPLSKLVFYFFQSTRKRGETFIPAIKIFSLDSFYVVRRNWGKTTFNSIAWRVFAFPLVFLRIPAV